MIGADISDVFQKANFYPVYLIYGSETFLINQMLKKMYRALISDEVGDFNYERLDGPAVSPAQVAASASTLPVFAEKRLVVVRDAPWFSGSKGEENGKDLVQPLITYLENPSPSTCLVMVAHEKIDSRRKIVKMIQKVGQVIEYAPLKGTELNRWIESEVKQRGKTIEKPALEYLSLAAGNTLAILNQEIEKAVIYIGEASKITFGDVVETVSRSSHLSVFDVIDAVAKKRSLSAVLCLREILKSGEPEIKILALLARQVRIMLQIQVLNKKGYTANQISSDLGIHPFVAKKGSEQCRNFSSRELVTALELLLETDVSIKTGKGNPSSLLETVVLKMCSSAR
jgi:DNA polymerase-3 subunit delta